MVSVVAPVDIHIRASIDVDGHRSLGFGLWPAASADYFITKAENEGPKRRHRANTHTRKLAGIHVLH